MSVSRGPRLSDIGAPPNLVSLARLALLPAALWFLAAGMRGTAVAVLAAMAATDWLDGYLARRTGRITELGKVLDPLADKVAIDAVLAFLAVRGEFPVWALAMIVARDVGIVTGATMLARRLGSVPASGRLGKATFVVLAATAVAYAGDVPVAERPLLAASVALAAASGLAYCRAAARALRAGETSRADGGDL